MSVVTVNAADVLPPVPSLMVTSSMDSDGMSSFTMVPTATLSDKEPDEDGLERVSLNSSSPSTILSSVTETVISVWSLPEMVAVPLTAV